jgi:hypothetical protein
LTSPQVELHTIQPGASWECRTPLIPLSVDNVTNITIPETEHGAQMLISTRPMMSQVRTLLLSTINSKTDKKKQGWMDTLRARSSSACSAFRPRSVSTLLSWDDPLILTTQNPRPRNSYGSPNSRCSLEQTRIKTFWLMDGGQVRITHLPPRWSRTWGSYKKEVQPWRR